MYAPRCAWPAARRVGTTARRQRRAARMAESERNPAEIAGADLLSAIYGWRKSESAYQSARSAGGPGGMMERAIWGPTLVVATARWGIEDDANHERIATLVERPRYARGRAPLPPAQAPPPFGPAAPRH